MYIFKLLILLAFSSDRTKSFVCPEQSLSPGITNTAQIVCCETSPESSCDQTLNKYLTPYQLDVLTQESLDILALPKDIIVVSNCFRMALQLVQQPVLSSAISSISPFDLMNSLAVNYVEITDGSRQVGDVLVFEEYGEYMFFEEYEHTYGKKYFWAKSSEIIHAAVYVGDDLLVQKENTFSAVMSVANVEKARQRYEWGAQQTKKTDLYSNKKTKVKIRTFRKK